MKPRIFLSPPHMSGQEQEFVRRAFDSNYIAPVGPDIDAFEREMAVYLDPDAPPHCAALASGTAGLHLALILAGVEAGDTVLCSDLSFIASTNPILYQGAEPVFVDVGKNSWNMDPGLVAAYLEHARDTGEPMPKALVLVHLYGAPADLDAFVSLCDEYGVTLIEDAAESLGAQYRGKHVGSSSRFGVFSFNGNKIITTSGGGMLACRDKKDAERVRFLATQAREPGAHYEHREIGYNYRLSNICAAIGRGQLKVLEKRVGQKRAIFAGYVERLSGLERVAFMDEPEYGLSTRWLTCALLGNDPQEGFVLRERLRLALEKDSIESRPVWKPMHRQPVFHETAVLQDGHSRGWDLFRRGLCLPSGTQLTDKEMDRICSIVKKELSY